jgi:hypothetical protein
MARRKEGRKGTPLPGALGQKLSIVRALLNIVKVLLMVMISLYYKHLF